MSFASNINFFTTILTSACVCFAASNFGIKLGKLTSFKNTSGFKYISESPYKSKFYESVFITEKPKFVKTAKELENWCSKYEKSIMHWQDISKYCLIKNNVRHQLINKGHEIKGLSDSNNNECTEDILNSYDDGTENSLGYLVARSKCLKNKTQTQTQAK